MIHFIKLIVCCAIVLWASPTTDAPPALPPEIPNAVVVQKWRSLRLAEKRGNGFPFLGTGFALIRSGKAYVVTNAHILKKASDQKQIYADFEKPIDAHHAEILATDEMSDIANPLGGKAGHADQEVQTRADRDECGRSK